MTGFKKCTIDGCSRKSEARGWCNAHWWRWKKYGDPLGGRKNQRGDTLRFIDEVALKFSGDDCLIWPFYRSPDGRAQVRIKGKTYMVSRIVCQKTSGDPPTPYHEAAHSCGKGHLGCISAKHLDWKTHTENMADKITHGTTVRGEKVKFAKLSEAAVRQIPEMKKKMSQKKIATLLGVDPSLVSRIVSGERWRHVGLT